MLLKEFTGASIPEALERKYPNAPKEQDWQYIFPSRKPAIDPRSGKLKQHYRHESFLQKAVKNAIRKSQITKNASCHTFRHCSHYCLLSKVFTSTSWFICYASSWGWLWYPHCTGTDWKELSEANYPVIKMFEPLWYIHMYSIEINLMFEAHLTYEISKHT